jgi:hypothetical protein
MTRIFLVEEMNYDNGELAQLGEHLPCTQGVNGSIPLFSTIYFLVGFCQRENNEVNNFDC